MSLSRPIANALAQPIAQEIGDVIGESARWLFLFDGVDQYALMNTPWVPRGLPWRASVTADANSWNAFIFPLGAPGGGDIRSSGGNNNAASYRGNTGAGSSNVTIPNVVEDSQVRNYQLDVTASGVSLTVNSTTGPLDTTDYPRSLSMPGYANIGANGNGTTFFPGVVKNVKFEELGAITGGYEYQVMDGGVTYGELNQPIKIDCDEPFNIQFDWQNNINAATQTLLGNSAGENTFGLGVNDGGVFVGVFGASFLLWNDALNLVDDGQHVHFEIDHDGVNTTLKVDGELQALSFGTIASGTVCDARLLGDNFDGTAPALDGAVANLEITATPYVVDEGFPDYDSAVIGENNVVDKFSGTSSGDMGEMAVTGTVNWSPEGFLAPNDSASFVQVADADTTYGIDINTDGVTVQFEVESDFFSLGDSAQEYEHVSPAVFTNQGFASLAFEREASTQSFQTTIVGTKSDGVQTTNKTSASHDIITYSLEPGSPTTSTGELSVYRNNFLLSKTTATAEQVMEAIVLTGFSGVGVPSLPANIPYRIRNVVIKKGPVVLPQNMRIMAIGDSNIAFSQYAINVAQTPNNFPAIEGYNDPVNDYAGVESCSPNTGGDPFPEFAFYDETAFALLHRELAAKGLYPENGRIEMYARAGSQIVDRRTDGEYNDFNQRTAALYGETYEGYDVYPVPSIDSSDGETGSVPLDPVEYLNWLLNGPYEDSDGGDAKIDTILINMGGNDLSYFGKEAPDSPRLPTDVETDAMLASMKANIDTMIDTSNPGQVLIMGVIPQYGFDIPPPTVEQYPQVRQYFDSMLASLDGYREVCKYVEVASGMQGSYTVEGVHLNSEGQKYWAGRVAAAIDGAAATATTYSFPLTKNEDNVLLIENTASSGSAYNGTWSNDNWEYINTNNRLYMIDEGQGTTLFNGTYDPLTSPPVQTDAVLTSAAGWIMSNSPLLP